MTTTADKKEAAKKPTADEKVDALIALAKANGWTIPKHLDADA